MASMNTERLYRMCACVSMDYNSGTKQNVNAFFLLLCIRQWANSWYQLFVSASGLEQERKIRKNTLVVDLQKYTRDFVPTSNTQFAVFLSILCLLGSQPCMISPITNQQSSPWSHLIVRFVTADTLNMSTYEEDCVWQGNWAAYVFSVKWQEWRIDPETHTKIAISILDVLCWEKLTPPRPLLLIEPRQNFPLWWTRNTRAPLNLSGWNNDVILTVNRLVPKCSVSDQFTAHISASHAVNMPLRSITEPARQRSYAKTLMLKS